MNSSSPALQNLLAIVNQSFLRPGEVDLFDPNNPAAATTFNAGLDGAAMIDSSLVLYGGKVNLGGNGAIRSLFLELGRTENFNPSRDGENVLAGLDRVSALALDSQRGLLFVGNNRTQTGQPGQVLITATSTRGTMSNPATPLGSLETYPPGIQPIGMSYDFINERLWVLTTDSLIRRYDNVFSMGLPSGTMASAVFTLQDSQQVALQANSFAYDPMGDNLYVSDAGILGSPGDGRVSRFSGLATQSSGTVAASQDITLPARLQSDPGGLTLLENALFIYDLAENAYAFLQNPASSNPIFGPAFEFLSAFVNSIALAKQSSTEDPENRVVVLTNDPQSSTNSLESFDGTSLQANRSSFSVNGPNSTPIEPTSVTFDCEKNAIVSFSDSAGQNGGIAVIHKPQTIDSRGNPVRLASTTVSSDQFDHYILGANTLLKKPVDVKFAKKKGGILVLDEGDGSPGTNAIRVFGAQSSGNVAPDFSIDSFPPGFTGIAFDYDEGNDRLYVAGSSMVGAAKVATVLVYENFCRDKGNQTPDRTLGLKDENGVDLGEPAGIDFSNAANVGNVSVSIPGQPGGTDGVIYGFVDVGQNGSANANSTFRLGLADPQSLSSDSIADLYVTEGDGRVIRIPIGAAPRAGVVTDTSLLQLINQATLGVSQVTQ